MESNGGLTFTASNFVSQNSRQTIQQKMKSDRAVLFVKKNWQHDYSIGIFRNSNSDRSHKNREDYQQLSQQNNAYSEQQMSFGSFQWRCLSAPEVSEWAAAGKNVVAGAFYVE